MNTKELMDAMDHFNISSHDAGKLLEAHQHYADYHFSRIEIFEVMSKTITHNMPANIVGIGIGEKVSKGKGTGRPALKVFVRAKVVLDALNVEARVPAIINDIETDIEESGEFVIQQLPNHQRPVPGGVSIINCNENAAGTLGCYVVDNNGSLMILSNNHVLAMKNASPNNAPICQPSCFDDGICPKDTIANLTRFIPINFSSTGSNLVDAAVAKMINPALADRLDFGQTILKYFVSTSIFSCFRQYLPIALGRA